MRPRSLASHPPGLVLTPENRARKILAIGAEDGFHPQETTMAKGQVRTTREKKKPKTVDKKSKVPKYMGGGDLSQASRLPMQKK